MTTPYEEYRHNIRTGDLVAFSHGNIGGKIIQFFTKSAFTHVGIAYRVANRVLVFEAVIPRVRLFPLSKMGRFYHVLLGRDLSYDAEEFAFSRIGDTYSVVECCRGYFGIANNDNAKWQCAEYSKGILRNNGLELSRKDTPVELVTEAIKLSCETPQWVEG